MHVPIAYQWGNGWQPTPPARAQGCVLNFSFYSCPLAYDRGCCPRRLQATDKKRLQSTLACSQFQDSLISFRHWACGSASIYRVGSSRFHETADVSQKAEVPLHHPWLRRDCVIKPATPPGRGKAASVVLINSQQNQGPHVLFMKMKIAAWGQLCVFPLL